MKSNIGLLDRVLRIMVAAIITLLFISGFISGTVGVILLVLGGVFVATSFISFCPIYYVLGISSRQNQK